MNWCSDGAHPDQIAAGLALNPGWQAGLAQRSKEYRYEGGPGALASSRKLRRAYASVTRREAKAARR